MQKMQVFGDTQHLIPVEKQSDAEVSPVWIAGLKKKSEDMKVCDFASGVAHFEFRAIWLWL